MTDRLHDRWDALCSRIGAFPSAADSDLTFDMLASLYDHPPRAYHNLDHVGECLRVFDEAPLLAEDRDAVELALWLHDAIYVPERSDNELRSADAAGMIGGLLGCPPPLIASVRELILATEHRETPASGDPALVADIDLADLGADAERYEVYRRAIRAEFAFASDDHFALGRHAFLDRMLDRPVIYTTPAFRHEREARARENLGRERDALERDHRDVLHRED